MKTSVIGSILSRAAGFLLVFFLLCGLVYTLLVTGIGQALFPHQANGSVITVDGRTYGSELLAQPFSDQEHLWGRPMDLDVGSFTDSEGQPVLYAWASNKTPAGEELDALIQERLAALQAADPAMAGVPVPVDLVTVSGSGLDPEISPEAAAYQVHRIAQARGMSEAQVQAVIDAHTTGPLLGLLGEPRVNVLKVNLALDGIL